MKRIFSKSKTKVPPAEAAASTSSSSPGYQLKEKDLPKLHKTVWNGDLPKLQQLSKKNDVYALDKQNRTPLHLACAKGHVNIVNYLTSNTQASKLNLCDNDQRSALMKAVQGDFDECAEILLNNKADPNLVDRDGNTALHLAANHGFVHVAILLLNNGAMATPTNKTGSTPLHLATSGKHDEMVEILLEGNADVNATDNDNRTALMLACQTDQIGMVKMLLDNKADTEIKDSKGWTANDHAIMGGFHGCSHLIDEFNASRRPKSSVSRPSSAGLFGSTTGSDALGFSLGGPAVDNFDDDEDDDLSFGKGSVVDSWNASASEAEELPKTKPKVKKPVNLGKFVQESDNESVRSGVSMRSSASRSRIPQSVSRQGSITSERSLQSARGSTSGSKLPRPASSAENKTQKKPGVKPSKKQEQTQGRPKRKDSWGSEPPTPVDSAPPTPRSSKGVTPRESFLPTPRGSILSALDTGSEWDDDDVLDALEDTGTAPKQLTKVPEQKEHTPEKGKGMQREESPVNQQRKEVLQGLGMSDVEDESSVAFSDDDDQDVGTVKRNVKASGDYPNVNEHNNNNKHGQMPPPEDEEEEDSEWDSDGDDLLPSETDNKGPPVIRPGALLRGDESEDNASLTPSPAPPSPVEEDSPQEMKQIIDEPQLKSQVIKTEESPVHMTKPDAKKDSPRGGGHSKDKQEEVDDDEWDSEDEDLEEESEWEKERGKKRASLGEELDNSGQFEELSRQNQWEEEEKQRQEKLRQEAEEELQREKEQEEEERRRQEEVERRQLEKEKAAEKRRQEEERAAEDRRRREEEEAEVERKRAEIEAERKHLEEVRRQEEERIQTEREQLEEERKRDQEKRDVEHRQLEAERKREEDRLEAERRRLEEEKRQTALQRDEEHRKKELALKEEEKRIEAERKRLEEQRQQEQEKTEEAKRQEEMEREKEFKNQESERRRLDEERRQMDEHRRRFDEEKKQLEQERKLEMERKNMEDERRKREEDRLKAERKRHEEMRRQFEEDQLKVTQELKDEDEIRRAMERKHLEDERQRLEEQRLETERRKREMEEQRMEEKCQLLSTQNEMEDMKRKMEEERVRFEQQLRENADRRAVETEKEQFEEAKKQEQDRLKAEKERLEAENKEIEKKRLEIQALQKQFEKKDPEKTLLRYQESIEKRLADEDRSVQSVNGLDDDNESLDDITRDLEAAVAQRQQIESGTYSANPVHTPGGKANMASETQSLANTGDFGVASLSQGNPLSSSRVPLASRQSPTTVPTNARSPTKALYNSPMLRSSTGPTNTVPTWQTVLSEPDGLDYTSSEGEEDMMATQDGLRSSLRSPYLRPSTPAQTILASPGSPISPSTNDPTAIIRLQGMVREQRRAAERERNERLNADNQSKILQGEKAELQKRLGETTKFKMALDQQLLDLEAKIRGLEHELSQELERRHNSEVLLQKTKEQLLRKEELYAAEIEAKQRTELASRNVQMDLRSAQNVIKQFEEERTELRRQLNQEKAARAIQEEIVNDHRRTQETLQEAEAVNRLEAADESRKAAMTQSDKLKTELYAFKMELEKQKMRHRDDQGLLVSENEELTGKIEELKNEMRVNEEALAHATMTYNAQLAAVRTENAVLHNGMEKERHAKDQLKAEYDSVQKRLDTTTKELEKAEKARSELEHALQRERDEWSRARERIEHENTSMKDSSQSAAQRFGAAESRVASLENELQAANTSLMERSNQLAAIQRDLDLRSTMQNSHDTLLHKQREENVKLSARVETLTERLAEAQTEIGSLKRALDAAQHHNVSKDKDTQNAQTRTIWEERNSALQESVSRLKEELQRAEHNSSMKDQDLRKLQQELTDSLLKVSITENHLEMARKTKGELERDKSSSKDHIKQLTDKVSSLEKERRSFESRVDELQSQLVHAERSNLDTSHQLMATQTTLQKKADLEGEIRHLEKENSHLEIGLKQETHRSEELARKLEDAQKMCSGLESMITNIKTSQLVMEDKLSEATAARSLFAREVDDHKQLWETEVKSRSKLGLRIAQLERAKTEIQAQVDEEKKKIRKMAELKRSAEDKWQNEAQRTQQLEQENATLRAKVKMAKKKLKDQGPPELRLSTMQTEFERERLNMEAAMGTLRRQLEDVNQQLDRESMLRLSVEKASRQLQQEFNSSKTTEKTKDKLERSKRRLEDELSQMKLAMENGYIEKGHLEKYKQELDAKARLEINEKLEQVNSYLEEQSQARDKLEQLRGANEAEMRKELENTIEDLKFQLFRLRNGYHDAQTRKDTMEAETSKLKEMYNHEIQRREKLASDLEKTQDKLLEAQAKLNFERQRNRHIREGSMATDMPAASRTPTKTSNPPPADSIAEKVWSELDKSITRHLQAGATDNGQEFSSDRLNNSFSATSPRAQENGYLATLRKNYFV